MGIFGPVVDPIQNDISIIYGRVSQNLGCEATKGGWELQHKNVNMK